MREVEILLEDVGGHDGAFYGGEYGTRGTIIAIRHGLAEIIRKDETGGVTAGRPSARCQSASRSGSAGRQAAENGRGMSGQRHMWR